MARIVDPELIADLVRALNVRGELAPFDISQVAVPIFDIGRFVADFGPTEVVSPGLASSNRIGIPVTQALEVRNPAHTPANVFDDTSVAPAGGTVLADTGQIGTGEFFLRLNMGHTDATPLVFEIQHRNAANLATLATYPIITEHDMGVFELSVTIAVANERFRIVNISNVAGTAVSWITLVRADSAVAI